MLPCFIGIKRINLSKKTSIVIRLLLPQIQRFITSIALKPIPKPTSRKNSKIENPDFISNFIDNPTDNHLHHSIRTPRKSSPQIMLQTHSRGMVEQLHWNHTSAWVFPVNLLQILKTTFPKNTPGAPALGQSSHQWCLEL